MHDLSQAPFSGRRPRSGRRPFRSLPALLLLGATLTPGPLLAQSAFDAEALRNRVEAWRSSDVWRAAGSPVLSTGALPAFYLAREFEPVWLDADGAWTARADSAVAALGEAHTHGLEPGDYHLDAIAELADRIRSGAGSPGDAVDAELLVTDAVLLLASHLLLGRVDPTRIEAEWIANRREASLDRRLAGALSSPRPDVRRFLRSVAPAQPEYRRLLAALAHLRFAESTGGWGAVPDGPTLRVDSTDVRVPLVRRRLGLSTDSAERRLALAGGRSATTFDADLEEAVRRFQRRHGLEDDGAVGAQTRAAMNVSVADRIVQVRLNLERWRWLPEDLGRRHVRVNIAAFETEVWDADTLALHMRSIVGRQYRMTPSFNSQMRYLVLAPYWHVPPTIAAVDKFPLIREDPGYVAASRMTLFSTETNAPVDPYSVDWSTMSGTEFNRRFRLRQEPGPANALGNVKFMFPNRHNVYLHDTPQRELFTQTARSFSSGCIRLEKPLELADFLLGDQTDWSPERIRQTVDRGVERSVNLSAPVPVYLLYFTAFVEADGTVHFRPDVYGRDAAVLAALDGDPPGP